MFQFYHADDFIQRFRMHRVLYLAGDVGTGKSSMACCLSYWLMRQGYSKWCMSTMPLAFALPPSMVPFHSFVAVLDELGTDIDARAFADRRQNNIRKQLLAFPRKLNIYIIVASRTSPDVSFRSLTTQRMVSIPGIGEVWGYAFQDGKQATGGWFILRGRSWCWRGRSNNRFPSPLYGHEYVPGSMAQVYEHFEECIKVAAGVTNPQEEADKSSADSIARRFGVANRHSANTVSKSINGGDDSPNAGQGSFGSSWGESSILGGVVNETANSGGIAYTR